MSLRPWDVVFAVGFVVYCVTRGVYERRAKGHERTGRRGGGVEILLFALMGVGAMLLPVLHLVTPWLSFAEYDLPEAVPWCGAAVMVAGLWLFHRSHADLGVNWSVTLELRKEHELVTQGVYRRIRHPMYAAIWLFSPGQGMLLANWLAGWSACAAFAAMYLVRLPREERMMEEAFGDSWRDYARRTGRIFPRLGGTSGG